MISKKVLILQETLFNGIDANSKLIFRIAAQLCAVGYDVSILGVARTDKEHVDTYNGIHLIHEPADRAKEARRLSERLGILKQLRYLLMPRTIGYRMQNKNYTPFYIETRRWLQHHVNEYDVLIACCSPYFTLSLAAEVANKIPVIYYKIDPVASWEGKNSRDELLATIENEIAWDNVASRIITTDVIFRYYNQLPTQVNAHKVVLVNYPNIYEHRSTEMISPIVSSLDPAKVHLFFVGKLYADIRHPQYLFDLMEHLQDKPLELHIVGPLDKRGFSDAFIDKYVANQVPNIIFHGAVSPQEADELLLHANVLVHIGNAVDNCMPSKILDYISTGKPILNICKIPTCPTLPLMKRYPIGMTLDEAESITPQTVNQVYDFCMSNKEAAVPYSNIEQLYFDSTLEYVGNQFAKAIQDSINEFNTK